MPYRARAHDSTAAIQKRSECLEFELELMPLRKLPFAVPATTR